MSQPTMGQIERRTFYQRFIAERVRDVDRRLVEAWMRLEHGAVDGLSEAQFITDMCAVLAPSFGL